jgi:hypothetical protein
MANYVFVYRGGMPQSDAEKARSLTEWSAWFKTLGAAVVDKGAPAGKSRTVTSSGGAESIATGYSGYSIVRADSIDAAIALAKSCPIYKDDGRVEVAKAMRV